MKIGIISDTHGSLKDFEVVMDKLKDADKIIHLGDVLYHGPRNPIPESYDPAAMAEIMKEDDRFIFLKGNCDSEVDSTVIGKSISESEMIFELGDNVLYCHHGHRYDEEEMVKRARDYGANIVAYGHTHKKVLKNIDGVLVVNPGSTSLPKDDSKSYAVYENGLIKVFSSEGSLWILSRDEVEDGEEGSGCSDCSSCGH